MDASDRTVRVIVGRKGAGKTLYLRRLQAAAARENSLYADDWQIGLPQTNDIIRVADWETTASPTVERWQGIWQVAILRPLVSHLLCSPDLVLSREAQDALERKALPGIRHARIDLRPGPGQTWPLLMSASTTRPGHGCCANSACSSRS
jgi:hypothetical protein